MARELWPEAKKWGFIPVETAPLRQALLPALLPEVSTQTVTLCAYGADRSVVQTAHFLAQRARYLEIRVPRGGEALSRELWQCYGLSGCGGASTLTVDFTDTVPGALSLGEKGRLECTLDGETLSESIAAALYFSGAVKKEEFIVKSTPFNA